MKFYRDRSTGDGLFSSEILGVEENKKTRNVNKPLPAATTNTLQARNLIRHDNKRHAA